MKFDINKLALERINQGLSYEELGKKAKVKDATISRIERGLHTPRPSTIGKIAAAMGKKAEDYIIKQE